MQDSRIALDRSKRHFAQDTFSGTRIVDTTGLTVRREDFDARCMMAIMDTLGSLPVMTVLQAWIFDPRVHDQVSARWHDPGAGEATLSGDELLRRFPYGLMLRLPSRRLWPKFVSAATGGLLHDTAPDRASPRPYENAFLEDPLFEGVERESSAEALAKIFRAKLVPLLKRRLDAEVAPVKARA